MAVPPSPARDRYVAACQGKLAECGRETGSFPDDWCTEGGFGYEMYTDAVYDALSPCFGGACGGATIHRCLEDKLAELSGGTC